MSPRWRRRNDAASQPDEAINDPDRAVSKAEDNAAAPEQGPFDISQVDGPGSRLDLGALLVPVVPGVTLRLEVQRASEQPVGVNLSRDGAVLQIQVFAAPRTAGIWDEIRAELVESITSKGGSAEETDGRFGPELRAKVPAQTSDGRTGKRSVRFIGVDGPRWFVRGVMTGKAATNPQVAQALEDVFADVVVNRGNTAYPPRDLLLLTTPGTNPVAPSDDPAAGPTGLELPGRGPEIAEVR